MSTRGLFGDPIRRGCGRVTRAIGLWAGCGLLQRKRTSKFAYAELHEKAGKMAAAEVVSGGKARRDAVFCRSANATLATCTQ
jgi:hypothetical protein